jgi:hypothetical protein
MTSMVTEGGNSGDRVPFALMSSIQRRKDLNFDPRLRYIAAQHFRMLILDVSSLNFGGASAPPFFSSSAEASTCSLMHALSP